MTIDSVNALLVRCNSRARTRIVAGSWAILGLMFVFAASIPRVPPSAARTGSFGAPPSPPSPNRLFFHTLDSPLESIDVGTGLTRTWTLDTGDAYAGDWFPGSVWNIAVAQDGQQVAYATRKDLRPWRLRVTDGVRSREIGSLEGLARVAGLAWSLDDREIAFLGSYEEERIQGENRFLGVMNVDSGEVENIMEPVYEFAWRPASREIIFSVANGYGMGIYVVDATREVFRRLRHFEWGDQLTPSPDGRRLLYDSNGTLRPSSLNLESGEVRKLDLDAMWGPSAWSPDGLNIVGVRDRGTDLCEHTMVHKGNLVIVDVVTGDARVLDDEALASPAWSPDGSSIAYLRVESCEQGTAALTLVDVKSGEKTVLQRGLDLPSDIWVWR